MPKDTETVLSQADSEILAQALISPPEPAPALKRAMEARRLFETKEKTMKVTVFKRTTDDWCPSYKTTNSDQFVKVTFNVVGPHGLEWRVCAWGADDMGMEKDFPSEEEAWKCFMEVIILEDVTVEALQKLGFVSA